MKRTMLVLFLGLAALLWGETVINGSRSILGAWDAGGAAATIPAKVGTVLPATCAVGEQFFKPDATAGGNLHFCTAPDVWTQAGARQQFSFAYAAPGAGVPEMTVPRVWTAGNAAATVTKVSCWTNAGTVSMTLRRSDNTSMHSALACSSSGVNTTTITAAAVPLGQGIGFTTASVSGADHLHVLVEYTRAF
jgi:hypothetical protein